MDIHIHLCTHTLPFLTIIHMHSLVTYTMSTLICDHMHLLKNPQTHTDTIHKPTHSILLTYSHTHMYIHTHIPMFTFIHMCTQNA